jgi:anaerobic magnesium-protoporphyrin IX monomethyl ester cyclase
MADVLLTHSNHLYSDRKQIEKMAPYPPLETLIVLGVLRQAGIDAVLFDPTFVPPHEGFQEALRRHRPRLVVVCEDDFNFLSKMCLTRNRELAYWMAAEAGRHGVEAAAHGSDASDHVGGYLDARFAAVIIGEAENAILELAQGLPRDTIDGLAWRDATGIRINRPRALCQALDSLPWPAWDAVNMDEYRQHWRRRHGYFALNLVSSRGCPYQCNWCARPIWGKHYHAQSPHATAQQMLHLKQAYIPDRVWFADDIFALSAQWTNDFADAVEDLGARIPFKMQSRCDLMTRATVSALRRAGCEEVWMGAESGSQRVLDAMDKGIRVEHIYQARENLARHGIRACFFLQFGYPGEDWTDIEQTITMVRQAAPDDVGVSVSYPLPGTKLYKIVESQLGPKQNWSDSSDIAMLFRGSYTSDFYRALAEALHVEVRGGTGIGEAWARVQALRTDAGRKLAVA